MTDSNGYIDTSAFINEGVEYESETGFGVRVIKQTSNNRYFVGGYFDEFNNQIVQPIIRIHGHTFGIEETGTNNPTITIYPNPASDIINIDLGRIVSGNIKIVLYNINGSMMRSKYISNVQTTDISISEITPGIYICEISGENFISREKIVIVRY